MPKQLLPRVKPEVFDGMVASLKADSKVEEWIERLGRENPQILLGIDAFNTTGALLITAYVYALLHSQAEADQMEKDFS